MSKPFPEVERFELEESLPYEFKLGRRGFLKMFGGGVAVVCLAPPADPRALAHAGAEQQGRGQELGIESWLEIHADGKASVYSGKVELGQGARTLLRTAAAEELRIAVEQIEVVLGDTDRVPYDMGTWGSQTVPRMVPQVRAAAAAAREMLLDLAATHFDCDRAEVDAREGAVHRASESVGYGELAADRGLVGSVPADAPTTAPEDWQLLGKSARKAEAMDVVTGNSLFASDLRLPGMLYGRVLRPPTEGAVLRKVAVDEAAAMEGVTVVHDNDFAGVCAPDLRTADRAIRKLRAEWQEVEEHAEDRDLWNTLRETAVTSSGQGRRGPMKRVEGDPDTAFADSETTISSTFTADFIAHAPMETRCAVAQWREDGGLNVWTSTQSPFGVRTALSRGLRVAAEKIRVRMTAAGGGFGGKGSSPEAPLEAARLARAAGAPVKVVWTREDEFRYAYFRPAALIDVEAGVRRDGKLTAWRFHDYNAGTSSIDTPYRVEDKEITYYPCKSPLRQGSYRALAATANNFAREMVMDELAEIVEMDGLEMRLANLDVPRLRDVLLKAADAFGWHDLKSRPGRGYGIACGIDKGSWVATCAEVALDTPDAAPRVLRLTTAFDCGAILNPDNLEHQVVGAASQGLGGALRESIGYSGGRIRNPRFSTYRVPRFRDLPRIEFVPVDRPNEPSLGAGETPIIAIAPAIGAAIKAAGGPRHHRLPMT
jgi:isoquinoline 1-oxidoreductase